MTDLTTTKARAWMLKRKDGLALGFTDHDCKLSFEGITFEPNGGFSATALVQGTGLSIDNTEAEGLLSADSITEADLLAGRWDNAEVVLWKVDWSSTENRQLQFRGSLGEVSISGGSFRAELRGLAHPLNNSRNRVFHRRCCAQLGDRKCRVDLGDKDRTIECDVIRARSGGWLILSASRNLSSRWFEHGTLIMLSGEAEGLRGNIKNDRITGLGREVDLWTELPVAPNEGDRVRLIVGCDKLAATCRTKFNNQINFRGFPHLPDEDWLMSPQADRN